MVLFGLWSEKGKVDKEHHKMDPNHLFNENAAYYDLYRPAYSEEIYKDILQYSAFGPNKTAIEIGCGTGQATKPFLDIGGKVIAIELGAKLAAFTRKKFAEFHNIEVVNIPFEDYKCEENSIHLVYSAQAFHWVSGGKNGHPGYPLVHQLLVSGGTLAVWWRNIVLSLDGNLDFKRDVQSLYQNYAPSIGIMVDSQTTEIDKKRHVSDCIEIQRFFRINNFHKIKLEMYYNNRTLSAKDYIGLLQTSPKYMSLDTKTRASFLAALQGVIAKHKSIELKEMVSLHMGMKK